LYLLTLQCEEQQNKIQQLQKQNRLIENEKLEIEAILRKVYKGLGEKLCIASPLKDFA